jgi:hypothetical protein
MIWKELLMRLRVLIVVVSAFIAMPTLAVAAPESSAQCENVSGTFLGQAVPWDDGAGFNVYNLGLTGPLEGHPVLLDDFSNAGEAQTNILEIVKALPNGGFHFEGAHSFFTSSFGPMETHDKGHITAGGKGHNVMTLVGNHAGHIIIKADVDLATGSIDATYHGRVCTH